MESDNRHRRFHCVMKLARFAIQTATLIAAVAAVGELERIHRRLKKVDSRERRSLFRRQS